MRQQQERQGRNGLVVAQRFVDGEGAIGERISVRLKEDVEVLL